MPRGVTDIRKRTGVHALNGGHNNVVASETSDFYFVVNDAVCPTSSSTPALTIRAQRLVTGQDISRQLVSRIIYVLQQVQARRGGIVQRGELLFDESVSIRADAAKDSAVSNAATPLGPVIPVSDYPPVLRSARA